MPRTRPLGAYAETSRALAAAAVLELGARVDWVETRVDDAGANAALYRAYHAETSTNHENVLGAGKARLTWPLPGGVTVAGGVGSRCAARVFFAGSGSWLRGTEGGNSADLGEIPPARGTAAPSYDDGRANVAFEVVAAARQEHVDVSLAVSRVSNSA